MLKKIILYTFIFIFLLFSSNLSQASSICSCEEDRILKLQEPYITGEDVREIQIQLKNLGYYSPPINGIYDKTTAKAVMDFQKSENLLADGIVGRKTLQKLAGLYEKPVVIAPTEKPAGKIEIVIYALDRQLVVMSDGKPYKSFPVAVGTFETPTPIGVFKITEKSSWGEGFGSRWMRLSVPWGVYGIHGTNKPWTIGGYESHGCIRMLNKHVEQVYEWVNVGTKVYIIGGIDGPFTFGMRTLTQGSKGADVVEVQKRLAGLGYYNGEIDGRYGWSTRESVINFQKDNKLDPSGNVDKETYKALGIELFE